MKLTVNFARTEQELLEAENLALSRYSRQFGVNLASVKNSSGDKFEKDVLIIREESQKIIATVTMMYPAQKNLFPTEDLFGVDIQRQIPDLAKRSLIEVGRVAKSENCHDGDQVMNALMLTTLEYLRRKNLDGWIATVKKPMMRFLRKSKLNKVTMLEHLEGYTPLINADVKKYLEGDDVYYFTASYTQTFQAFYPLYDLTRQGKVIFDLD